MQPPGDECDGKPSAQPAAADAAAAEPATTEPAADCARDCGHIGVGRGRQRHNYASAVERDTRKRGSSWYRLYFDK